MYKNGLWEIKRNKKRFDENLNKCVIKGETVWCWRAQSMEITLWPLWEYVVLQITSGIVT